MASFFGPPCIGNHWQWHVCIGGVLNHGPQSGNPEPISLQCVGYCTFMVTKQSAGVELVMRYWPVVRAGGSKGIAYSATQNASQKSLGGGTKISKLGEGTKVYFLGRPFTVVTGGLIKC